MSASIFRKAAAGNGILSETFEVPTGCIYRVISATLHLNAAATTSENLTITMDCVEGANYDTLLYTIDLAAIPTTNLVWQPDVDFYLFGGDGLDVVWTNTDGRTWGLTVTMEAQ